MATNYKFYNGITDYLEQEGRRAGLRADKPYNVYLMIKALEEAGTQGAVYNGEQPLIELITEENETRTTELLTVRNYLRKESKFIRELSDLSKADINKLMRDSEATEQPATVEEATHSVNIIRTIISTIQATQ